MVDLEQTIRIVSEDVGVVELCAVVYEPDIECPIKFPFDVSLSTRDDTAGKRDVHANCMHYMAYYSMIYVTCIGLHSYFGQ